MNYRALVAPQGATGELLPLFTCESVGSNLVRAGCKNPFFMHCRQLAELNDFLNKRQSDDEKPAVKRLRTSDASELAEDNNVPYDLGK